MHSYINTSILTEPILIFGCLITQVYNGLQLCFHGESYVMVPLLFLRKSNTAYESYVQTQYVFN